MKCIDIYYHALICVSKEIMSFVNKLIITA